MIIYREKSVYLSEEYCKYSKTIEGIVGRLVKKT